MGLQTNVEPDDRHQDDMQEVLARESAEVDRVAAARMLCVSL